LSTLEDEPCCRDTSNKFSRAATESRRWRRYKGVDGSLVTRLTPEAQAELRAFYEVAYGHAWRYLARMTGGDMALTEDLVQEVMLVVAQDLARGRSPVNEGSWVIGVARHRLLDCARRATRSEARIRLANDRSSPFAPGEPSSAVDRAHALLGQLPLNQRVAVTLRHCEGYSVPEIAELMGRSVEATESLISRGVRTLRHIPEGGH
jgi:RNA polymerase sigma-70 factor, ECF subfamily